MSENLSNKKITLSQKQAKKSSDIRDYILAGSTGCRRSSVPLGAIIFAENQKTFNEMKEDPITRKYFEKYIIFITFMPWWFIFFKPIFCYDK